MQLTVISKAVSGRLCSGIPKLVLAMQFTGILLLVACLQVSATASGQKVTIEKDHISLKQVFKEIRKQTDYNFIYSNKTLEQAVPVSLHAKNMSVQEVLNKTFKGQPLSYTIEDKIIIVKRKDGSVEPLATKTKLPQREITGVVKDSATGQPLTGVTIKIKGENVGTITDAQGKFSLEVPDGAVLEVSYLGYNSIAIPVEEKSNFQISLAATATGLNQLVVVGYGVQKKKDLTGAIATIPQERLKQLPNNNYYQALQGAVPGIYISQSSSSAEQNSYSLIIHGRRSIDASNSALKIVDGIPYNGSISAIPTSDIANISVLKDASAVAIYGSRGANGVILITTKKGRGKAQITYNGTYGIQKLTNLPHILNGEEFYQFKETRSPGLITASEEKLYQEGKSTDWLDQATRTGQRQEHHLSVSGGNKSINYYISGDLLSVKGVAINDNFKRYSLRTNIQSFITKWLTLSTNTQLTFLNRSGLGANFSRAFFMNPLTTAYDSTGKLAIYPWPENPYYYNPLGPTQAKNKNYTYSVISNNSLTIDFPFLKGLQYKLNTGIQYRNGIDQTYYNRDKTVVGLQDQGNSSSSMGVDKDFLIENILSFKRDFGKNDLFITGLYSFQQTEGNSLGLSGKGFVNDALTWYQYDGAKLLNPSTGFSKEVLISQMLRINYGYDSRYLITLTGRRDGYSGFGADTKYSLFPSAAFAWNIAEETFFSSKMINNLKLRVSLGNNGNQAVGPYRTLARLSSRLYIFNQETAQGYIPSRLANPDLGWETTTTFNVGLDFGLWSSRLKGSIDIYNTNTHDLLLNRSIPSLYGLSTITQNIGKTNNKGIDIGLTSYNIQNNNFSWKTHVSASANKNKVVSLVGNKDIINDRLFIGKPIRVNYGYVFDGIWQEGDDIKNSAQPDAQPGFIKLKDINGDGKISSDSDRAIQGYLDPSFIWGMGNTFTYKNFSLYIFIQGVTGVKRFNPLTRDDVYTDVSRNTVKHDWWTPDNPTNTHWSNNVDANPHSIEILQSAAYARLKDISLSYNLENNWLQKTGLREFKIYLTASNLITITKWTGLDPELNSQRAIPLTKQYEVGLTIGL